MITNANHVHLHFMCIQKLFVGEDFFTEMARELFFSMNRLKVSDKTVSCWECHVTPKTCELLLLLILVFLGVETPMLICRGHVKPGRTDVELAGYLVRTVLNSWLHFGIGTLDNVV